MTGGIKAHYDCIKVFSETDLPEDLKKIDLVMLVMHGDDDEIVPIGAAGLASAKILKNYNQPGPDQCRPAGVFQGYRRRNEWIT